MRTVVLIPTKNEINNIKKVIQEVESLSIPLDLIVIDASTDETPHLISEMMKEYRNILYVHQEETVKGLGAAYKLGFALALEHGYDKIVTMDGDGSHSPRYIQTINAVQADVVLGSRYINGGSVVGWGYKRKLISLIANYLAIKILRLPYKDVTTGYRCYQRRVIKTILPELKSSGFSLFLEIVYQAHRHGFNVVEVPIIFVNRKSGKSKLGIRECCRFLRTIFELRFRHIFS